MLLETLLGEILRISKQNNLSTPYMVGGVPRDRFLGKKQDIKEISDIDLTTGNEDSIRLAELLHRRFPESYYKLYDDGHATLKLSGVSLDFSSNFVVSNIDEILRQMGVHDIDDMKREIYSRDFTINTLLESLDFKSIYDITGQGIKDLQSGIIKCPIDPRITIGVDARRILRAIKFAVKYNFSIENSLKQAMLEFKENIQTLPTQFVQNKMNEIVVIDSEKGLEMLIEYKLLPLVPLTKTLSDLLIQNRQLLRAL